MENDYEIYKGQNERFKSIALKAKKESSDDETLTSKSDDKEYAMVVRNFKKFFRRKGKFIRQPREEKNHSGKGMIRKARLIGNVLDMVIRITSLVNVQSLHGTRNKKLLSGIFGAIAKMRPRTKLTKKLVSWPIRQMWAPSSKGGLGFDKNEVSTSGTKHMHFVKSVAVLAGHRSTIKAYIILNKHTMKVKESLNVTFNESSPPTKLSLLVDDDVSEEEAIERKVKVDNNVENESIEVDEVVNIKESKSHPLEQVI
ncbi:hypothetical protein Tco_1282256 [Tanacetum coccineum]